MSQLIKPFVVIVPAAGRGDRFNQELPKQYTLLDGISILQLSLEPIISFSECLGICLVISREDSQWESLSFEGPELNCIEGGKERFLSVLNGINFWQNSSKTFDFILIHDAVRPCIRKSEIESLFKTLEDTSIDGAILGAPCSETMKEVSRSDHSLIIYHISSLMDEHAIWLTGALVLGLIAALQSTAAAFLMTSGSIITVSYTHLTLPTNREV